MMHPNIWQVFDYFELLLWKLQFLTIPCCRLSFKVEIIEILHRVPREMLLIFKTNDLLRGLDSMLGVKDNTASFVTMSRSCANANYIKNYSLCTSSVSKFRVNLSSYLAHFRITVYQILLWWASWWNSATIKS